MSSYHDLCPAISWNRGALLADQMNTIFLRARLDFPELLPRMISCDPPILVFDNFTRDDEITALYQLGHGRYAQSLGHRDGRPIAVPGRTSLNAWCTDACDRDRRFHRLRSRIEEVTHIPAANFEKAQLLYYFPCNGPRNCSFYHPHHDLIPEQLQMYEGVRIFTFFVYMNDVEEGGETRFTKLGLTVKPRKGRAVFWPNVFNDRPNFPDERLEHESKSVIRGEKYAVNFWLHQKSFHVSHASRCTTWM